MEAQLENVFFYGLFMDESLLLKKGIKPYQVQMGYAEDFALKIGARATLIPCSGKQAYGMIISLERNLLEVLYSDPSVDDYKPRLISVVDKSGKARLISTYLLVEDELAECNREYARALLDLAETLGFPQPYLQEIRRLTK